MRDKCNKLSLEQLNTEYTDSEVSSVNAHCRATVHPPHTVVYHTPHTAHDVHTTHVITHSHVHLLQCDVTGSVITLINPESGSFVLAVTDGHGWRGSHCKGELF